jgi:hypothetical protein
MGEPTEHIAAWEAAGLIDAATAARLRAAGPGAASHPEAAAVAAGAHDEATSQAAAMFGPSVTVPEVFGNLGTGFLLAGWTAFVSRLGSPSDDMSFGVGIGALVAAVVLVGLGLVLRRGDARRRRSAGVAFRSPSGMPAAGSRRWRAAGLVDRRLASSAPALRSRSPSGCGDPPCRHDPGQPARHHHLGRDDPAPCRVGARRFTGYSDDGTVIKVDPTRSC